MENQNVDVADATTNQPTLRTLAEIQSDLKRPIHPSKLKTKKQGGTTITFIEWYVGVQYLDLYAPGWTYKIDSITSFPNDQVICTVSIGIPTSDFGTVWRSASGCETYTAKMYGDPASNATAMALKRAAAHFGLGLYLYNKK